jgi:hypothetical protein
MATRTRKPKGKPRLPRAPLPKQTGGAHEDKSKRPFRKEKHKKRWLDLRADETRRGLAPG